MTKHFFEVRGTWPFPVDMLRYDACEPASEADRILVADLSAEHPRDGDLIRHPTRVRLVHEDASPHWEPTEGRWRSFMWRVI